MSNSDLYQYCSNLIDEQVKLDCFTEDDRKFFTSSLNKDFPVYSDVVIGGCVDANKEFTLARNRGLPAPNIFPVMTPRMYDRSHVMF